MSVHDWARVEDAVFHAFHHWWIGELGNALNAGLLPPDYYALPEQHAGRKIADVLTLHASDPAVGRLPIPASGALAVLAAPPRTAGRLTADARPTRRRKTLAIRHSTGHRIVALIEVVSAANKDRRSSVREFAGKIQAAVDSGVHVLVLDLCPPGPAAPRGMHAAVWSGYARRRYLPPAGKPLGFASYAAGTVPEAYVEPLAVGDAVPRMPLFLSPTHYIPAPLPETYESVYRGMPDPWRAVLDEPPTV